MEYDFKGKVAVVTGAGSGQGRATALAFARAGAHVVISDVNADSAEETAALAKSYTGGMPIHTKADVSLPSEVLALVDLAIERYGRLDCAANVAGLVLQEGGLLTCTEDLWSRLISVNLTGVYLCMQAQVKRMMENGSGAIVNISSIGGLIGSAAQPAYVAAKHGVIGLTKSVALEFAASGIRVNAICPGFIRTKMTEQFYGSDLDSLAAEGTPMRRIGRPDEIAQAILWLCSDASSFVTGHVMTVDGGLLAGPLPSVAKKNA